jgi:hypothetical protein
MNKLILLLLFAPFFLGATNYYVSTSGSDAANGLTPETAFETINKLNTLSFSANDTIFFNRSDTFIGQFTIPSSGSSSGHIVITNYGTGVLPLIHNSTKIISTDWTDLGGNIWQSNGTTSILFTIEVGNIILNDTLAAWRKWDENLTNQGDYYYDFDDDYVLFYSTSNPSIFYHKITLIIIITTITIFVNVYLLVF